MLLDFIKDKKQITKCLNIALFLLAINFLAGNLGMGTSSITRVFASFILIGIITINIPLKEVYDRIFRKIGKDNIKITLLGIILLIFSFIILLGFKEKILWLISISVFISGLDFTLRGILIVREELPLLSITSFSFALFVVLVQNIPPLWHIMQNFSLMFSKTIGSLTNQPTPIGPSISGLWIILVFLFFSVSLFFLSNKKKLNLFLCILGLIIAWITCLLIRCFYSFELIVYEINLQYILFFLCLIPITTYILKSKMSKISIFFPRYNEIDLKQIVKSGVAIAVVLMFVLAMVLTLFHSTTPSAKEDKGKILFYGQHMLGGWDVPKYGIYEKNSASFGLLPVYLDLFGYKSRIMVENKTTFINETQSVYLNGTNHINLTNYLEIVEYENLTKNVFDDVDIFVVTNLNESFSLNEYDIIWDFVENGGSLLVLGDHTDIAGIMTPLNELLKPVEIGFNFDSAYSITGKWLSCLEFMNHPINFRITDSNEIRISVGASLNISSSSFPIVIGKYAFSDFGNHLDYSRAFLGDFKHNSGEQLGDIVLVAGAYYGNGKVLVFGDTSPFQNAVLPHSHSFINNVFMWLNSKETSKLYYTKIVTSLIMLGGLVFLLHYIQKEKGKLIHILFPLVLCISIMTSSCINNLSIGEENVVGPVAYIDASHGERFDLKMYEDNGIEGLTRNLARNAYPSLLLRDFSENKIDNSKILIFIAPTESINKDEVNILKNFMSKGGLIILSTGYEDKSTSEHLLNELGFDILNCPLGPVPYCEQEPEKYQNEPRFVDSWPILIKDENNVEIFYSVNLGNTTYQLIAFREYGQGGFLLIGDSQFLLNKNLESQYINWPGNIRFF